MEISIKYENLKLDKVCGICLLEQKMLQIIPKIISEKLLECASVQLPDAKLLICNLCEKEINKWHSFKQQVTRAVEIFKEISQMKKIIPDEDIQIKEESDETDTRKKHECTKCDQSFLTHGKLRTHMKIHKMEEGYQCDHCDKIFPKAQNLWRHKRRISENKPYPCTGCTMSFPFKHALDRHYQARHGSSTDFSCPHCSKQYKVKETLTAHIKKYHFGKDYGAVCNICGKFCISQATLNVHLRSHTGERPFKCDFCQKSFMTKDHLTLHKRIHTGERPYKCQNCDRGFISSSVLRKHKRSHTGERPYKCHLCDKKFSLSSTFKAHLKRH